MCVVFCDGCVRPLVNQVSTLGVPMGCVQSPCTFATVHICLHKCTLTFQMGRCCVHVHANMDAISCVGGYNVNTSGDMRVLGVQCQYKR